MPIDMHHGCHEGGKGTNNNFNTIINPIVEAPRCYPRDFGWGLVWPELDNFEWDIVAWADNVYGTSSTWQDCQLQIW